MENRMITQAEIQNFSEFLMLEEKSKATQEKYL